MDIKLKKYSYSVWFKLLAVILCIAGMQMIAFGVLKAPYFEYVLENNNFDKHINRSMFREVYSQVSTVAFKYKNEEYIKSGALISDRDMM